MTTLPPPPAEPPAPPPRATTAQRVGTVLLVILVGPPVLFSVFGFLGSFFHGDWEGVGLAVALNVFSVMALVVLWRSRGRRALFAWGLVLAQVFLAVGVCFAALSQSTNF